MDPQLIRSVSLFRELTDSELTALASLMKIRQVKAGTKILEEGVGVSAFSLVCDGVVHVRRLAQKREMLLGRLGVGAFFGEINLFDPGVATASVYAMKEVRLAEVPYETLREFLAANPAIGYKVVSAIMAETSRRLRQTSSRLVSAAYWASNSAAIKGP